MNQPSKSSSSPSLRGPADHDIRDQIVAAANEHFSQYGYGKTTVSDLAKAIGFSKAYIYKFLIPSRRSVKPSAQIVWQKSSRLWSRQSM